MESSSLHLKVDTKSRIYSISCHYPLCWYTKDKEPAVNVVVEYRCDGNNLPKISHATEEFRVFPDELGGYLQTAEDLSKWFHEKFIYYYADLFEDKNERAQILFEVGEYQAVTRKEEQNEEEPLYVCVDTCGDYAVASFYDYESAEQWANEIISSSDIIETVCTPQYKIFRV